MTGQLGTRLVGTARLLASLAMWSFIWASSWHSGPRKGLHIHRGRSCEASWGLGSGLCTTSLLPHSIGKASLRASLVLRGCRFHLWLEELQSHKGPCILEGKDFVLVTQSTTSPFNLLMYLFLDCIFPVFHHFHFTNLPVMTWSKNNFVMWPVLSGESHRKSVNKMLMPQIKTDTQIYGWIHKELLSKKKKLSRTHGPWLGPSISPEIIQTWDFGVALLMESRSPDSMKSNQHKM